MSATKLYKNLVFLHYKIIEKIKRELKKLKHGNTCEINLSLDLNKTFQKIKVTLNNNELILFNSHGFYLENNEKTNELILNEKLIKLLEHSPEKVFAVDLFKLEATPLIFESDFGNIKLKATDFAPTMEIDGIKMHRSENINPFDDSKIKAREVVKRSMVVLDTCTGLGYTAISAIKLGARHVISYEKNEVVLKIAQYNPWSLEFFNNPKIESRLEDIYEAIFKLKSESFDAIIHDPPRFSLAGELYSLDFYKEVCRVLKPNGKMFHYIGDPNSAFGKKHYAGINSRLREAGFQTVIYHKYYGIVCQKPPF